MRLLVLGGSGWLSGHVARAAVQAGDDVVCVSRGATGRAPKGTSWIAADRDVSFGLTEVSAEAWDAVVDVSSQPGQVRRASRALASGARFYVYVSSVSVYAVHDVIGADEDAAVLDPLTEDDCVDMQLYGNAKVACEDAVREAFGGRSLIARAGLIGGPGDPTARTTYWPWRFAHPSHADGRVLVPDAPADRVQVIDVRDLASWIVAAARDQITGTFDAVGTSLTLAEHLGLARAETGSRTVAATETWLRARDVQPWVGERSLPLWIGDPAWRGMGARDGSAARAGGLALRPLEQTLRDGLVGLGGTRPEGAGLTDEAESALLGELDGPGLGGWPSPA